MRLIRNTGETITAADDGRIIKNALGDGLFESVEFTISNGQINIPAFKGVLSGRDFTFDAQSLVPTLPTTSTPVTGQIIVRIDLSSETPLSLITVLDPYELTYDDLNESGVVCEMKIATYTASLSGVISVTSAANNIVNIAEKVSSGLATLNNTVAPIARHNVTYAVTGEGDGIYLQGGGTTIIGAGEVAQNLISNNINNAQAGTSENVHVAADSTVFLYSNCQTIANRKTVALTTAGNLDIQNGGLITHGNVTVNGAINATGTITTNGHTVYPITYKDVDINLHTATWRTATNLYYTEINVSGWQWIYGVSIAFWGGLTGMVQPYIVGAGSIGLMSTSNSFPSTNATIRIRIMGTRVSGD